MAEQPTQQPEVVEETIVDSEQTTVTPEKEVENPNAYHIPRGAIAFGILMILGYAFYFFMIWTEVIARGGQ